MEGQTDFTISMKEDTQKLDEVVVIGYGTQKKMNLTGSVATISAENIVTLSCGKTVTIVSMQQ